MARYIQTEINYRPLTGHVNVAEQVLGRRLPKGAVVHHVDMNGRNNAKTNLVICPSQAYHMLLHLRQRAFDESGNANWRKCPYCKKWDDPKNMFSYKKRKPENRVYRHQACQNLKAQQRRENSHG